jgi:signal peptidase I
VAKKSSSSAAPNAVAAARAGARGFDAAKFWAGAKSLAGTVAIFLLLRTFLLEAYRIPSGSMVPAMLIGDWLFVNKLVYGPHVPFTDINLPGYQEPRRDEIVVFVSPPQVDQPWDPTPTLVKRLVGLGGDTLYMRDGQLYIDGIAHRLPAPGPRPPYADPNYVSELFAWQQAHEVHGTRFGEPPAQPTLDSWGPLVVPPGYLFMLGDARYDSKDSRYWGLVPRQNVRGRPMFVYYSWKANGESDRPLPWLTDIRWGRIGHRFK